MANTTATEVRDTLIGMLDNSELDRSEVQALIDDEAWAEEFAAGMALHGAALAERIAEQLEK